MKKTLYTIAFIVCAAFSCQGATLWTTTFGNANQADGTQVTLLNEGIVNGVAGSVTSLKKNPYNGSPELDCPLINNGAIGSNPSLFTPWYNVQTTGSWTAGMSFTNGSDQSFSVSSVSFTVLSFAVANNNAIAHTRERTFALTLTIGGKSYDATVTIAAGGENSVTFNLDGPLLVNAGNQFSYEIRGGRTEEEQTGGFLGIKDIAFNGELLVPEPATASLSLFGLAVLGMVRRRRD